jgi:hypothetical protein
MGYFSAFRCSSLLLLLFLLGDGNGDNGAFPPALSINGNGGVVPNVAYHSSMAVLLWYLSMGAQYGMLQEANYMPNAEFVQHVPEEQSMCYTCNCFRSHL